MYGIKNKTRCIVYIVHLALYDASINSMNRVAYLVSPYKDETNGTRNVSVGHGCTAIAKFV